MTAGGGGERVKPPKVDHDCSLLPFLEQLLARLDTVERETALLQEQVEAKRRARSKATRARKHRG